MERGSGPVWAMIAYALPRLSDRDLAISFLLSRVIEKDIDPGNCFQALASIGDPRAIPALRERYEEYRANLTPLEEHDFWSDITDYLACCAALWRLDGSPEYEDAIRQLFTHPDFQVRSAAQRQIAENRLQARGLAGAKPGTPAGIPATEEKLLIETEWSRVYSAGNNYCWYISKFRTDGLEVSAESIRQRWPSLTLEEQVEFAHSFCQKPAFNEQDLHILQLLIEEGLEYIRSSVGFRLREHPALESVLPFLLGQVMRAEPQAAKYYKTLGILGDARAIPALRQRYEAYRMELRPFEQQRIDSLFGYLRCCHALWILSDSAEYRTALEEMLSHPDEQVRREASRLLPHTKS
ncbi:MAG: hypothetical protein HY651_01300 [Acidobacteria bacterium]|nr:hypothetical protein [Acidobacteriota bacterium]